MGEGTRAAPPRPPRRPETTDFPAIPDLHHCEIPKPVHGWMGTVDVDLDNWIRSDPSLAER